MPIAASFQPAELVKDEDYYWVEAWHPTEGWVPDVLSIQVWDGSQWTD